MGRTITACEQTVKDRWCIRRDMPEVMTIEQACFGEHAWTEEDWLAHLRQRNTIAIVAEHQKTGAVVGYLAYELYPIRLEIIHLAIHPDWQRQGIGQMLVKRLQGKIDGHQRRFLLTATVEESNLAAQLFLASQGFQAVGIWPDHGIRMNYRTTPTDRDFAADEE